MLRIEHVLAQADTEEAKAVRPKLPKHIRLKVYGYIDLENLVKIISKLSKLERCEVKKSSFARSRKKLVISHTFLSKFYRRHHMHGLGSLTQKMEIALCLSEHITIDLPCILPKK